MKGLFTIVLLLGWASAGSAQIVTGLATYWSDSFREWIIYTDDENEEGELRLRWADSGNWKEWDFRLGEISGQIRQKWPNDPNAWELWADNETVAARTVFPNDFREWRITDGQHTITLFCRYGNTFDEWSVRSSNAGNFEMYTQWQGDPRDWVIVDELGPTVSLPTRMMMAFIVAFHSSPKE